MGALAAFGRLRPASFKFGLAELAVAVGVRFGEHLGLVLAALGIEGGLGVAGAAQGVCVTVLDRGPGIPEVELSKVLQPFYRVEASRHRNTGGVGLGLASASDIARLHGGCLQLRNRPGCGLQAELRLPRQSLGTRTLLN